MREPLARIELRSVNAIDLVLSADMVEAPVSVVDEFEAVTAPAAAAPVDSVPPVALPVTPLRHSSAFDAHDLTMASCDGGVITTERLVCIVVAADVTELTS